MKSVILTGGQGFIGSYLANYLLDKGYIVYSIDNYSKYGRVIRPQDSRDNFKLIELDLTENRLPLIDVDYIIAGAAAIGGISYFSKYPYKIVRNNEKILANTFDTAIDLVRGGGRLKRIVVISSSMVYEGADQYYVNMRDFNSDTFDAELNTWPTYEGAINVLPPPLSCYGAQKAFAEVWARAAWEEFEIPYTIVRPFNAVGAYENEALGEVEVMSGNVKLQMSHVLPDLVNKCLKGQDPLHILGDGSQVRCYTNGKDIARGIVIAMESEKGFNEDFNISTPLPTSVLELAEMVWKEINGDKPFRHVSDKPFQFDVQRRIPDVSKAAELLGFQAEIPLSESIKEVVKWMRSE